jgi:predicted RNase H-like HicB family nuclease
MSDMEPLDFDILGTFYERGEAALSAVYSPHMEVAGRIRYRVHQLCESGLLERTHTGSYLITPKGRERFLQCLAEREPQSPLLKRKLVVVNAEVEPLEEGGYLAFCDDIQGCHAEGETVAEALANLEDVARVLLELRRENGLALPEFKTVRSDSVLKAQVVVPFPG